jgi:azurin
MAHLRVKKWTPVMCAVLALGAMRVVQAAGTVCKLAIGANDLMQYDKTELKISRGCAQIELTLTHTGKLPAQTMGHTWVLTKTADVAAVVNAGIAAGAANDYVAPGEKRVIASTKIVGGGQSAAVTFPASALKAGEDYTFFCNFPGHAALMKGKFIVG